MDIEIKTEIQTGIVRSDGSYEEGFVVQMRNKDQWLSCGIAVLDDPKQIRDFIIGAITELFYHHGLIKQEKNPFAIGDKCECPEWCSKAESPSQMCNYCINNFMLKLNETETRARKDI